MDKYPRAYSFCKDEDTSVAKFLTATTLAENFHLPLSPEALAEIRGLQHDSRDLTLSQNEQDQWI